MRHLLLIIGVFAVLLVGGLHSEILLAQKELVAREVALSPDIRIGDRIGRFRFLGMLELDSLSRNGLRLSQVSALAWDEDDGILYALSDKGGLFHLQPQFEKGYLTGVRLLRAVPLRELGSGKPLRGWRVDAEGMDILDGRNGHRGDARLIISMERVPQIVRYRPDGFAVDAYSLPGPINQAGSFRSSNRMLESVCVDSTRGVLTIPEVPLKKEREDHNRIFSLSGTSWLYPVADGDRITAVECLGKDELLILQQNFLNPFGRIVVTLNRIRLTPSPSSGPLSQEKLVTFDSDQGYQLDNFEGLARHHGQRFFLVSDDNDLFVQRTLLLYFELLDE